MARFVATTDFESGEFLISQEDDTTNLEAVIDRLEVEVLQDLMGVTLYDLFIADLDTGVFPQVPNTARFTDIYDAFYQDDPIIIRSEGIVKMLQMLIYFEFVKDQSFQNSPTGMVQNEFENSIALSNVNARLESTYNRGIRTYNGILDFIIQDNTTYPEYDGRGIVRQFLSWL